VDMSTIVCPPLLSSVSRSIALRRFRDRVANPVSFACSHELSQLKFELRTVGVGNGISLLQTQLQNYDIHMGQVGVYN